MQSCNNKVVLNSVLEPAPACCGTVLPAANACGRVSARLPRTPNVAVVTCIRRLFNHDSRCNQCMVSYKCAVVLIMALVWVCVEERATCTAKLGEQSEERGVMVLCIARRCLYRDVTAQRHGYPAGHAQSHPSHLARSHMQNGKPWGAACRPAPLVMYTDDRGQCASLICSAWSSAQRVGNALGTCLARGHRRRSTAISQNSERCRQAGTRPPRTHPHLHHALSRHAHSVTVAGHTWPLPRPGLAFASTPQS
jgi:hypothetical protein